MNDSAWHKAAQYTSEEAMKEWRGIKGFIKFMKVAYFG